MTLWTGIGTLERMSSPAAALPLRVTPAARGWTPQPLPVEAPKSYIGARLGGRYLLRRRIGAGGMSTVYEALDSTLGKRVMVKILRDDLPSDPVDRFRREAHVLAGLTHEHIARIIDRQDPDDGPRFLVSDYIDGHDLGELCGRGPMPTAVVILIGLQVAAALAYAHNAGVIHRDIKPSNLMLTRHPSGDIFVQVIDFGISKLVHDSDLAAPDNAPAGARRATCGDVVLGTAPYWCGEEGPRADVYALALTLAVLLTGDVPPVGVRVDLSGAAIACACPSFSEGGGGYALVTGKYAVKARKVIIAVPPVAVDTMTGDIVDEIRDEPKYQDIIAVPVVTITQWWPDAWWADIVNPDLDADNHVWRAWTTERCLNFIEIPIEAYAAARRRVLATGCRAA